ncbi:MAG: TraB/GumN family protein [Massilia sp.]
MHRRIIVVFWSLLLVAAPVMAQERGALFKVSANGHTMHLFGTIHLGRPDFFPLEKRITDAVTGASTLALEVDAEAARDKMPALIQRYGMRDPAAGADTGMPPELEAGLARVLKKVNLDLGVTMAMQPWMVAVMLSVQQAQALGYSGELGTDVVLARLARGAKVKVVELESMSAQLTMFHDLSNKEQWTFLGETVGIIESGEADKETRKLVDAWRHADRAALDAIAAEIETDQTWTAKFTREVMLEQRNVLMTDKLVKLLASENKTVAAVGLLHLLGQRGLPEKLRARGFKVERIY